MRTRVYLLLPPSPIALCGVLGPRADDDITDCVGAAIADPQHAVAPEPIAPLLPFAAVLP